MSDDVTPSFFHWMEAHNITRPEAASLLGVDERSLSTYRSRGLPRKKQARALQIMAEKAAAAPATELDHRVIVEFSDNEYATVERATEIVGSTLREFIVKSTVTKAREEIAESDAESGKGHPPPFELAKVAEDPTPYKVTSSKHL
jgi:hypothetical protein